MELYNLGGYITILLYGVLLDETGFRDYMASLMEVIIKKVKIKKTHPYTLMFALGTLFLLTSWFGLLCLLLLIGDFLIMKHKNKNIKK